MDPSSFSVGRVRRRAGLSLRALATAAGTSHSTLAAYETGRVAPSLTTFARIVDAAGFIATLSLERRVAPDDERGRELIEVLRLAEQFPARHHRELDAPIFGLRRDDR